MSSSPAWLTVAFSTLATSEPPPDQVLRSGLRHLPSSHILHHLNRWARHVWRPAVTSKALSTLTERPDAESLHGLGGGALSLLAALMEAVKRCGVEGWVEVLGVMFLADDPWIIEVGGDGKGIKTVGNAMRWIYERREMLKVKVVKVAEFGEEVGGGEDGVAELRCRVAALQLQLDDVTDIVRKNEKNSRDMLSSFHFWSMLLLDELRGYKAMVGRRDGEEGGVEGKSGAIGGASGSGSRSGGGSAPNVMGSGSGSGKEGGRGKRVFRDGKWVAL